MPIVELKISGPEDAYLAKEIVTEISILTKSILNKKPEVTVVTVTFIPDYLWFVNSEPLTELKVRSYHLSIKISDSTNIKTEKANYIYSIQKSLSSLLKGAHPVSYVAIQEIKADAYGYDGVTMEKRYIDSHR